jgi:hypothetical protein
MRVLTDVKQAMGVVDRELGYLDDVYFALRTFCDLSVIELRSLPIQRRLRGCLRNIVDRTIEPARTPLVARIIGQEPGRWIEAVLKIRRSGTFRSPIFRWLFGAYEAARSGFENEVISRMPRPLLDAMDEAGTPISALRCLQFRLRDESSANLRWPLRDELEEKGYVAAISRKSLSRLLRHPKFRPNWPQFVDARRVLRRICDTMIAAGRSRFDPTDSELETVIERLVAQATPALGKKLEQLLLRIGDGDLVLPEELRSKNLQHSVAAWFEPVQVDRGRIQSQLQILKKTKHILSVVVDKRLYYVTNPDMVDPVPLWDEIARKLFYLGKPVTAFNKHPAWNQAEVLSSFQRSGWRQTINVSFGNKSGEDEKNALRQAVKELNKRQSVLQFTLVGNGSGVSWTLAAKPA